jgi:hypothetical protein
LEPVVVQLEGRDDAAIGADIVQAAMPLPPVLEPVVADLIPPECDSLYVLVHKKIASI